MSWPGLPGCWPCCGRFFAIAACNFSVVTPSFSARALTSIPPARGGWPFCGLLCADGVVAWSPPQRRIRRTHEAAAAEGRDVA